MLKFFFVLEKFYFTGFFLEIFRYSVQGSLKLKILREDSFVFSSLRPQFILKHRDSVKVLIQGLSISLIFLGLNRVACVDQNGCELCLLILESLYPCMGFLKWRTTYPSHYIMNWLVDIIFWATEKAIPVEDSCRSSHKMLLYSYVTGWFELVFLRGLFVLRNISPNRLWSLIVVCFKKLGTKNFQLTFELMLIFFIWVVKLSVKTSPGLLNLLLRGIKGCDDYFFRW